ncbi:MAG: hypothetical protein V7K63_12690 [Nostoc sp.]
MQVDATKVRVDATKMQVDAIKVQVDATKMRVDATKMRVDATKMRVDATKMQVNICVHRSLLGERNGSEVKVYCFHLKTAIYSGLHSEFCCAPIRYSKVNLQQYQHLGLI